MSDHNFNILFLGGGSIGAIYAWLLSQHACTITVAVRSTYPVVSSSGYKITSSIYGNAIYRPERVICSPSELAADEVFDYIVITTKATGSTSSTSSSSALPLHGYPVSATTTIVLIQNGIGVETPYASAYPGTTILSGVAYIIASQPAPGEVLQSGESMRLFLGFFPARGPGSGEHDALIARLNAARIPTQMLANLQRQRWSKLLFNGCYATVCAATGLSTLPAWEMMGGRELIVALGHEIRRTAVASGYDMTEEEVDNFFETISVKRRQDTVPSMLQDAQKGVEMEIDVLCGNVWRIAEKFGVETPRMRTIYAILNGMNIRSQQLRKEKQRQQEAFRL